MIVNYLCDVLLAILDPGVVPKLTQIIHLRPQIQEVWFQGTDVSTVHGAKA